MTACKRTVLTVDPEVKVIFNDPVPEMGSDARTEQDQIDQSPVNGWVAVRVNSRLSSIFKKVTVQVDPASGMYLRPTGSYP